MSKYYKQCRKLTYSFLFLLFFTIGSQASAATSEDKVNLVSFSNWALVAFSDLFSGGYSAPFEISGYLATKFGNGAYLGIKDNQLYCYIDSLGGLKTVGSVADIMAVMAASNNGIVNLSGEAVVEQRILGTLSPGFGVASGAGGTTIGYTWQIIINEGTAQQETYGFSVTLNAANLNTVAMASYFTSFAFGADSRTWTSFAFSNEGVAGIYIDYANNTLIVNENIVLSPMTISSVGNLTIFGGGTLILTDPS